jgi:hypothetical protein
MVRIHDDIDGLVRYLSRSGWHFSNYICGQWRVGDREMMIYEMRCYTRYFLTETTNVSAGPPASPDEKGNHQYKALEFGMRVNSGGKRTSVL